MPFITRRKQLDAVPAPLCPAAARIAGTTSTNGGIVCRVMEQDRMRESGVNLTPAQLAGVRDGGGVFLTMKSDPSTIERICCGDALPVVDTGGQYARDHYTFCPVWQAEVKRIAERRELLAGGGLADDPEPTSMGVETDDTGHVIDPTGL